MVEKKNKVKGVILAAGTSSRLFPITKSFTKHFLPVFDKPMIYYPMSVLMLADIKDILIIVKENELNLFKKLLGNGNHLGLNISYEIQNKALGIADALFICKNFVKGSNFSLILGDNIFYGSNFSQLLLNAKKSNKTGNLFAYYVNDPKNYGIIEFNNNKPIRLIEKPKNTTSNYAITGLYFYNNKVFDVMKDIKPSKRGELEITDVNNLLLKKKQINITFLNRGFTWLDTGNPINLSLASQFVMASEKRQGLKIACLEEIAFRKKYIDKYQFLEIIKSYKNNDYGLYLSKILKII